MHIQIMLILYKMAHVGIRILSRWTSLSTAVSCIFRIFLYNEFVKL